MITLLAFIVTLGLLIVVHEYGHYRVARACGVKVLRFSIGFGRVIWRRQRDAQSTEFVICALPLGGYVDMFGKGNEVIAPSEQAVAFNHKPLWQRAAVVAAGPLCNLVLAVLLYAAVNWVGVDEPAAQLASPPAASLAERAGLAPGDRVLAVSTNGLDWHDVRSMVDLRWATTQALFDGQDLHLSVASPQGSSRTVRLPISEMESRRLTAANLRQVGLSGPYSEAVLRRVLPEGPAERAGLRAGDRVLSVGGVPVRDAAQLHQLIRTQLSGAAQAWRVQREGQVIEVPVAPTVTQEAQQQVARVGVEIGGPIETVNVRYGPLDGLAQAVVRTWDVSVLTLRMLGRMVTLQESLQNISGPLTMADYAGQSARLGLVPFLTFLAVASLSIGVLNLLPVPVLDGGHLMYYLFEAVTGRPISDLWLERLQRGGLAIVLLMMSLALFNDVARHLR
jgi:regulator of sigma E protease